MVYVKRVYDWMGRQVHSHYATPFLALLFFIEAIFFIPVDPILILYCVEKRRRALFYAFVATVASVAGGVLGYYIGYAIWETVGQKLIHMIVTPEDFNRIIVGFKENQILAVLIFGFSPLPYKAITLAAGFCKLSLLSFIICSFISRGARFFLYAVIIHIWGEQIKDFIERYFNTLVLLFTAIIAAGFWFILK